MEQRELTITVVGVPGPQGSKNRGRNGGLYESSKKVAPWREAVIWAARQDIRNSLAFVSTPVDVSIAFTLSKPKSAPKTRRTFPDRKPDIDKLCRSTLDALVIAGTIEDDARVVTLSARKLYPNEGADALDVPGAVIRIRSIL